MKFMHLSDLHIGKRVNEFSMIDDQKYILNQILDITDQNPVDAIVIAGDIYDKTVPAAEAVQLLDEFLTQLSERKLPVFAISGNHDSAERLSFGARLMKKSGVYFTSVYQGKEDKYCLTDEWGEVWIYLLPFLKPATVRHVFGEEVQIESYNDAIKAAVSRIEPDRTKRNILVSHQFVTGAERCDSEEVAVGGLDNIDVALFADFDYVALGHIHSPQTVGRETVRYCGTPLKYSFSEANQEKSVTIVEIKEKDNITIHTIPLLPVRDMRKIKGTYLEVTDLSRISEKSREDYIQIILTDEQDVPDALQKLRVIFPNLMRLEYDNLRTRENRQIQLQGTEKPKSELELTEEFYEIQNNQQMDNNQRELLRSIIKRIREE